MNRLISGLVALGILFLSSGAMAQATANGKIVTACGTPPYTYIAGHTGPLLMDTTGNLCGSGGGGGGGGTSSNFSATFPTAGTAAGGEYLSVAPTFTSGQMVPFQTDVNGNIKVDIVSGGGTGGTSSTVAAAAPSVATAVGFTDGTNMRLGTVINYTGSSYAQATEVFGSLPAGANLIGGINNAQVNGVTVLTGAGATGTGAQRVGVAQDTTTIAGSAPGTAGTASANVITVQGVASMTPLLTNPGTAANWGIITQGSTTSGQSGQLAMGAVTTAAPTYTTAQSSPLSLDTAGNLRVNVVTGGGSGGTSSSFSATFPATGTASGAEYLTSAPTLTNGQMVAFQTDVNGNLKTNVVNTNANGRAVVANSSPVVSVAAASTAAEVAPNNTTAVVVKGSAGTLFGVQLAGLGSAPAYVKIYNAATATCGSGTPVKRLMIPAAATAANGAGSNVTFGPGLAMSTGITYCVTTGIADTDTTAPAASTFLVNVDFE